MRTANTETHTILQYSIYLTTVSVCHITQVKVKLSLYRPRHAPRAPGGDFQTVGTQKWEGCRPCAPGAFTPRGHPLVLTSDRSQVDHRAVRINSKKNFEEPIGNRTRDLPACSTVP